MISRILRDTLDEMLLVWWDDEETQKKVRERVLDPMLGYITDKLYPYILISATIFLLLLVLLSMILWLILTRR